MQARRSSNLKRGASVKQTALAHGAWEFGMTEPGVSGPADRAGRDNGRDSAEPHLDWRGYRLRRGT